MWFLIFFILGLLILSPIATGAQDVYKFELKEQPYVDSSGKPLESIKGMKNSKGIDEFRGGGKSGYPGIPNDRIIKWDERGTTLRLITNLTPQEVQALGGEVESGVTE